MADQGNRAVTLFWTGGWDSTFRLLYLLLVLKRQVQPYYLIDSDRLSTGIELKTMKRIRARLVALNPDVNELLRPVMFEEISCIPQNRELTESFRRLRTAHSIGTQYDWLARFADDRGLDALELCIQAKGRMSRLLGPLVVATEQDGERVFQIGRQFSDCDLFAVFKYFRFPVFDVTKPDMERISHERGFDQLLELSWFCHAPRPNGSPCGVCTPCTCVMEQGMSRRVPRLSRARYYGRRYLRAALKGVRGAYSRTF